MADSVKIKKKRGKKYLNVLKLLGDGKKMYTLEEAIPLLKKLNYTKFDATVNLTINLKINPQKPEQHIRGTITPPHGLGKDKKIAVICPPQYEEEAKSAGADYVGLENLIQKIKEGWFDFDVLIATPEVMPKLAPLGKILGPRGLMPNIKNETVTKNIKQTVQEFKKGKIQIKNDKYGIIHLAVGKISMPEDHIIENIKEIILHIDKIKPGTVKGEFIESVYISLAMSPSLQINFKPILRK